MGIYESETMYGIRFYTIINDDTYTLYLKRYDKQMTRDQTKEAFDFYNNLHDKMNVFVQVCVEYTTTHEGGEEKGLSTMWFPMSINRFIEKYRNL